MDFDLQPLLLQLKSYRKDINHFLNKIEELGQLPEGKLVCTTVVVCLNPNLNHDEGLACLKNILDSRFDKQGTTDTLIEHAELVLKNKIFKFSDKTYVHKFVKQQLTQNLFYEM